MDLSAQEVNLSVPELDRSYHRRSEPRNPTFVPPTAMDLYTAVAIVMLVAWAGLTVLTEAPGFVHLLLTAGVFLLIWRIVVRGSKQTPPPKR